VKRKGLLTTGKGLTVNAEQVRAWQQRTQQAAFDRARARRDTTPDSLPEPRRRPRRTRRNDSEWRMECLALYGEWCRVPHCQHPQPVQMDHLIARAQGGPSVAGDGFPMCRVHHQQKTDHLLLIAPEWLDPRHVRWLSDEGHAEWLADGVVVGRHCRIFADGQPDRSML
jgi:hypothetical protein